MIDDYQTMAPLFASLGMKAVFTGHFHANDIVAGTFGGRTIYDIETGSTVTWPCPYRVMDLSDARVLTIATHAIEAIDYDLGVAPDFQTYAYDYLATGMVLLSAGLLYQTFYPYLSWDKALEVAPATAEAMIAHYAGDERFTDATHATQAKIVELMTSADPVYGPLYQQIGGGRGSLLTDTLPLADNTAVLNLGPAFWTLRVSATGNGNVSPAAGDYLIEAGIGTNVVARAAQWYRIASLTTNEAALPAAAGQVTYDAVIATLGADQTNHVVVTFSETDRGTLIRVQ